MRIFVKYWDFYQSEVPTILSSMYHNLCRLRLSQYFDILLKKVLLFPFLQLDLEFYLKDYFGPSIRPASLTFMKVGNATKRNIVQLFCPMDMEAYLFELERRDF